MYLYKWRNPPRPPVVHAQQSQLSQSLHIDHMLKAFHHFSGSFLQFSSMFTSALNQEHRIEPSTPVVQLMRGEGSHPQPARDIVLFLMQPRRGNKDALLVRGLLGPFLKKVFSFVKRPFLNFFFPAIQSPTCANYSFLGVFFFFPWVCWGPSEWHFWMAEQHSINQPLFPVLYHLWILSAICPIIQVTSEDHKTYWLQYQVLEYTISNWLHLVWFWFFLTRWSLAGIYHNTASVGLPIINADRSAHNWVIHESNTFPPMLSLLNHLWWNRVEYLCVSFKLSYLSYPTMSQWSQ